MALVKYDFDELKGALDKTSVVQTHIEDIINNIISIKTKLDERIVEYYADYFSGIHKLGNTMSSDSLEFKAFYDWLNNEINLAKGTDEETKAQAEGEKPTEVGGKVGETSTEVGEIDPTTPTGPTTPQDPQDPSKPEDGLSEADLKKILDGLDVSSLTSAYTAAVSLYSLDPNAWDNIPSDVQDIITAKLQELGYTDEEIDAFKKGNTLIPTVVINTLKGTLEDVLANHSELREEIKAIYGFDIFDKDGKIDMTKLAMLLLMDLKNEDDIFDILVWLRDKYGIDLCVLKEFGISKLDKETWDKIPEEVKAVILTKLKEVGYTDSEIEDIISGKTGVPRILLSSVKNKLEAALVKYPEIRKELTELYGFDVFDDKGQVIQERLILMLLVDAKKDNDKYDVIKLLRDKYGINLIDADKMKTLYDKVTTVMKTDNTLQEKIVAKYGIDIINKDKTINTNNLTLVMLIDDYSPNDDFDLLKLLG